VSDSRTISERGASATVVSSVAATLSPTLFTGSGRTDSAAASDPAVSGLGAQSWGRSVFNVSFQLSEAFSFTYSGHYFGTSDALFAGLVGRLEPIEGMPLFADAFRFFPNSLDETRNHSGVLMPGSYSLILVSDPLPVIAPSATQKRGGFDFTFDLAPVAATPEPSSIVLLGLGLTAVLRRAAIKR
jgi:PEP-CTERM motif